jgi:AAA+ superfamily predicted ATPase
MSSPLDPFAREIAVLSRAGYPLISIVTQEEQRALALAETAARAARKACRRWSVSLGFHESPDEDTPEATAAAPEAALSALLEDAEPGLFVFLDFHPFLGDPRVVRRLRDRLPGLVRRRQSIVLVGPVPGLPAELEKDAAVVDLPLPTKDLLLQELGRVARAEKVDLSAEVADRAVRSALGLSMNEASRVFRKVMVLRRGLGEADLNLVVEEKKHVLRTTDVLEFHELGERLDDVGGLGELKRWLGNRSRAFGEEARAFGLPAPKGLLLLGVQGCGKSLSAKAVAELWKFPLLRLDLGAVFAGAGGSPEAAIRQAIKVSESLAPVVLWVDEIEKGFSQVESGESSVRVFGSFLTWLAEKRAEVFVVATANDVSALPPELLRRGRFDEVFFVDLPNQHERRDILEIHLRKRGREPSAYPELEQVAELTEHFSGAELETVVTSALYRAFSHERELAGEDLALAAKQTVPLYRTYEEKIKGLRDWARTRARPATRDASVLDLFGA